MQQRLNDAAAICAGRGATSTELATPIAATHSRIVIQSPYLVFSHEALELFCKARQRGVRVRINTNSLASTDNLPAFGGYRSQREALLELGLEITSIGPMQRLKARCAV